MDTLHTHPDPFAPCDTDRLDKAAGALWHAMERFNEVALDLRHAHPEITPIVHAHAVSHQPLPNWTGLWRAFPSHLLDETGTAHSRLDATRALTQLWNRWCGAIEAMQQNALILANTIADGPAGRGVRIATDLAPSHKTVLAKFSPWKGPTAGKGDTLAPTTKGGFPATAQGLLGIQAAARTLASLEGIGTGQVWRIVRGTGAAAWHMDITAPTASDALRWAVAALDHDLGRNGPVTLWREETVEDALAVAMGTAQPTPTRAPGSR